ncbi:hypothetical protein HDK77DRAFT_486550 [Phyllosticta capitalensis]|uniref:Ribosomal protein S13 n=1 Tax=Phyllosticta capitalensis TaxID=121624 RepID=A0ABR1YCQ3_9PEZI
MQAWGTLTPLKRPESAHVTRRSKIPGGELHNLQPRRIDLRAAVSNCSSATPATLPPWFVNIFGNNFDGAFLVKKTLQTFYGVGPTLSRQIMARFNLHKTMKLSELQNQQVLDLNAYLSTLKIENDLRRTMRENIARLREIGSYRGRRHAMGLPVRGQNTKSQIQTSRRLNRVERKA